MFGDREEMEESEVAEQEVREPKRSSSQRVTAACLDGLGFLRLCVLGECVVSSRSVGNVKIRCEPLSLYV